MAGTCQYCGCTDEHGCEFGCFWVDDDHTLCSACDAAERAAVIARNALAQLPRDSKKTVAADWAAVPLETRRLSVMATRVAIETVQVDLDDGLAALHELSVLLEFLLERFPGECDAARAEPDSPSPVDLALRLLATVGERPRIVVP